MQKIRKLINECTDLTLSPSAEVLKDSWWLSASVNPHYILALTRDLWKCSTIIKWLLSPSVNMVPPPLAETFWKSKRWEWTKGAGELQAASEMSLAPSKVPWQGELGLSENRQLVSRMRTRHKLFLESKLTYASSAPGKLHNPDKTALILLKFRHKMWQVELVLLVFK